MSKEYVGVKTLAIVFYIKLFSIRNVRNRVLLSYRRSFVENDKFNEYVSLVKIKKFIKLLYCKLKR